MSPRVPIRVLAAQSDERLMGLVRDGHERAFEALVYRYRRPLLRYCRRLRLSETRAEDVLQQSFTQAWVALAGGSEVRDLRAWLYRITHNAAVSSMRRTSSEQAIARELAHGSRSPASHGDLDASMAARAALGEIAALPEMQREAMFLTVAGGSHEEVASALGISGGAVRGLLHRARVTLRSAAAALAPPSWIARALSGSGAAERTGEVCASGGSVGAVGLVAKGAIVAAATGVIASGAIGPVGDSDHQRRAGRSHPGSAAVAASSRPVADRARLARRAGSDEQFATREHRPGGEAGRHEASGRSGRGSGAGIDEGPGGALGAGSTSERGGGASAGTDGRGGGGRAGNDGGPGGDEGSAGGSSGGSSEGSGSGGGSGSRHGSGPSGGEDGDTTGGGSQAQQGGPSRSGGGGGASGNGDGGSIGSRDGSSQGGADSGASTSEVVAIPGGAGSVLAGAPDSGH